MLLKSYSYCGCATSLTHERVELKVITTQAGV